MLAHHVTPSGYLTIKVSPRPAPDLEAWAPFWAHIAAALPPRAFFKGWVHPIHPVEMGPAPQPGHQSPSFLGPRKPFQGTSVRWWESSKTLSRLGFPPTALIGIQWPICSLGSGPHLVPSGGFPQGPAPKILPLNPSPFPHR